MQATTQGRNTPGRPQCRCNGWDLARTGIPLAAALATTGSSANCNTHLLGYAVQWTAVPAAILSLYAKFYGAMLQKLKSCQPMAELPDPPRRHWRADEGVTHAPYGPTHSEWQKPRPSFGRNDPYEVRQGPNKRPGHSTRSEASPLKPTAGGSKAKSAFSLQCHIQPGFRCRGFPSLRTVIR